MEIIKKMHYKSKLILCYLVLVSFPLILCLILLYQSIVKPVRENAVSAIDQRLEQELSTINSKIEKIRNVSYLVSTNTVINKFFVPKFYGDLELIEILNNDISPLLSWLEASSPEVSYYHFFTNNPSIPDTQYLHHYDDYRSEPWMQEMEQSVFDKGYYLEPYHQNRSYSFGYGVEDQMVYSLFYPLLTANNFLEVCIKPSVFFEDMKAIPAMESGFVAAVNRDGKVISDLPSTVTAAFREALEQSLTEGGYLSGPADSPVLVSLEQTEYLLSLRKIDALDSWILCAVPNAEIVGPVLKAQQSFALVILAAAIGIVLLSYLLSTLLIRKINTIIDAVHKIQEGDFHVSIPVNGEDEIDQLATDINYMSYKINELINRVYKARMLQKETELSALQAQINPHFLFNILDTFKMIAIIHDLDDFSDSIAALGNLMRYNISPASYRCTLEHELQIIHDYINIQNLLLNNRVTLLLTVPDDLLRFEIPNFIIQPIIENSFVHGFENKLNELIIKVSIYRDGSNIIIQIEDNGMGIGGEQQQALTDAMKKSTETLEIGPAQDPFREGETSRSGKSIGLLNVNLRLFLLYRDRYSFTFSASDLGGACNTISLPVSIPTKEQEENFLKEQSML